MHGTPNPYPPPAPLPDSRPPNARQRNTRGWVIVAVAAASLVGIGGLAAAVSPDDQSADKPAAATTTTTASPSPTVTQQSEAWEHVRPTDRKAFVAYLHSLDPGLTPTSTGARARPLRRAVSVCWEIYEGKPPATVLRNAAYRYNGGMASVPQGSAKAKRILAAVKRWICSSPSLRKVYDQRHP